MAKTVYLKTALTGGGSDALDNIDGAALLNDDVAIVMAAGALSVYLLDADSAAAESPPDVIRPDTSAGDKRWLLQSVAQGLVTVPYGGTGLITITDHGVMVGSGTGNVTPLAVGTNGQVLVGSTGADPVFAAITPGEGIDITGGAGTLQIDCELASDSNKGVVELATDAEAVTGTGTALAITPANLTAHLAAPKPIGETTPNTIRGKKKEIYKTSSATSPLTAAECADTIVSNYGMTDADCVIDLATAIEGLDFICILPTVRARYFRLRCPSAQADKIYLLGVAGSDDGYVGVASGYAAGACARFFTFKNSDGGFDWMCVPIFGTWIAG